MYSSGSAVELCAKSKADVCFVGVCWEKLCVTRSPHQRALPRRCRHHWVLFQEDNRLGESRNPSPVTGCLVYCTTYFRLFSSCSTAVNGEGMTSFLLNLCICVRLLYTQPCPFRLFRNWDAHKAWQARAYVVGVWYGFHDAATAATYCMLLLLLLLLPAVLRILCLESSAQEWPCAL